MTFHLQGSAQSREVYLNGIRLVPEKAQSLYNHSPDGFNWGYSGSGPSQLALSVLFEITDDKVFIIQHYHMFRDKIIAELPQGKDFSVNIDYDKFCKTI